MTCTAPRPGRVLPGGSIWPAKDANWSAAPIALDIACKLIFLLALRWTLCAVELLVASKLQFSGDYIAGIHIIAVLGVINVIAAANVICVQFHMKRV